MVRWFFLMLMMTLAACQPNPSPIVNGQASLNPPLAGPNEQVSISLPFTPSSNAKVKVGGSDVPSSLLDGKLRFAVPKDAFGGPQRVEVNDSPNSAVGSLDVLKISSNLPVALQNVANILTDNADGFKQALENLPNRRGTYSVLDIKTLEGKGKCGKAIVRVKISGIPFGEGLTELKRLQAGAGSVALHVDPLSGWAVDPGQLAPKAEPIRDGAAAINAGAAQARKITGQGVTIAVLDSGVSTTNQLGRAILPDAGKNFTTEKISIDPNLAITEDLTDAFKPASSSVIVGHGTPAAYLAVSVAISARILPVKTCDQTGLCLTDHVIQGVCFALDYAAKNDGVNKLVINLSLGGETPSVILHDVLQQALEQGAVVVAAAGNGWEGRATRVGALYEYPAAFGGVNGVPAGLASLEGKGLISAGALRNDGAAAPLFKSTDFTNRGDYPDVAAPGELVQSFDPNGIDRLYTGTSFATPLVAGAAALWREVNPSATPGQIEKFLEANAINLGVNAPPEAAGAGMVDLSKQPVRP
jgi:subtilisin